MVKNLPCKAGDRGSIPGGGTRIPHAAGQLSPCTATTQEKTIHGHHQMVNIEIRLIIFFAAKDGEALYSQQKQFQELTVAQTMNFFLPNSDLS